MEIRPYQKGDEKEILALDRRLEDHPWNRTDLSNWYWKYADANPSGKSFIWVMTEDEKIIAHFAAVPFRLKVFDEEIIASHTIAALVESKYQNRGLLKFISDKLFEDLKENNIPVTYGFPNKRSYTLHKGFMGYSDLIFFDALKITKPNLVGKQELPGFHKIDKFGDDFDNLWDSCRKDYKIAVVRNKNYLNWRYIQRPDWKYFPFGVYKGKTLGGYTVLKLYREDKILRGHILDVFTCSGDKDTLDKLVDGSLNFFSEHNVDEVTCWIWGNPLFEEVLEEKGFSKENTKIPLVIRMNKQFDYAEEIKDNMNWYFTMGDSTEIF
ncbi:MAG: GNAT family N-acetyltransferase [Candidatus Altiarchaeota archaeon]